MEKHMTKADVERWHKQVSRAGSIMAEALAKGKRSPSMADSVLQILTQVVNDIRDRK